VTSRRTAPRTRRAAREVARLGATERDRAVAPAVLELESVRAAAIAHDLSTVRVYQVLGLANRA
jgi:hypothetical protein